jgi:hypothetical protein
MLGSNLQLWCWAIADAFAKLLLPETQVHFEAPPACIAEPGGPEPVQLHTYRSDVSSGQ